MVEQLICNHQVASSTLASGSILALEVFELGWAWQMSQSELGVRLLRFLLFEEALEEAFFGFFGRWGIGGSGGCGFGLGFFQVDGGFDPATASGLGGFVFGLLEFGEVEH